MCTERNGVAGVRGHQTINLPVLVVGTGRHQTVSVVCTAQMSRAQYIAIIYPPGCMVV
jgi:hypothetical protein